MSRFSFDPQHAPGDAYRQFYRASSARAGRATTDAPPRPADTTATRSERAIPQADGEP